MEKVEILPQICLGDVKEAVEKILYSDKDIVARVSQLPKYVDDLFKNLNPTTLINIFMLSIYRIGELLLNNIKEQKHYSSLSLSYGSFSDPISKIKIEINFNKKIEINEDLAHAFAIAFTRLSILYPKLFTYSKDCIESEFKNTENVQKVTFKSKIKLYYNELYNISIEIGTLDVYIERKDNDYIITFKFNIFENNDLEVYNVEKVRYFKKLFDKIEIKIEFTTFNKNK